MLVDTHCHIHDARFDEDRAQVITRARDAGIGAMITIGCDFDTTLRARALSQVHSDVYFSAGFHPHEAQKAPADLVSQLRAFAIHEKCVAIGECGLDFYYDHSPREIQKTVFEQQMVLAQDVKKALVVHVRNAYDECIEMLSGFPTDKTPVIIHCFSSSIEVAERFLAMGCYLSIPGILTFKEPGDLEKVVVMAPMERLLVETDSPYLAPLPYRGKRNEPAYVVKVAEKIAALKSLTLVETSNLLTANSCRAFNLPGLQA